MMYGAPSRARELPSPGPAPTTAHAARSRLTPTRPHAHTPPRSSTRAATSSPSHAPTLRRSDARSPRRQASAPSSRSYPNPTLTLLGKRALEPFLVFELKETFTCGENGALFARGGVDLAAANGASVACMRDLEKARAPPRPRAPAPPHRHVRVRAPRPSHPSDARARPCEQCMASSVKGCVLHPASVRAPPPPPRRRSCRTLASTASTTTTGTSRSRAAATSPRRGASRCRCLRSTPPTTRSPTRARSRRACAPPPFLPHALLGMFPRARACVRPAATESCRRKRRPLPTSPRHMPRHLVARGRRRAALPNLYFLVTRNGGHVGWCEGLLPCLGRWSFQNRVAFGFIDAVLGAPGANGRAPKSPTRAK